MGKFHQFLTVIFPHMSIFSFPDDNIIKGQWIFTKLGKCIDSVQIWSWIANGKFSQILTELSAHTCPYFHFWTIT